MNTTISILKLTTQKTKQVKKQLMPIISLIHTCTLATPSPSSSTLNLRHPPFLSTIRMSSTIDDTDVGHIFKQKKLVRSKVRKSLKDMDPSQRAHEDDAIQQLVLDAPWFRSSRRLCAYISCRALREVDTSKLLAEILQTSEKDGQKICEKTLYVPRVEDKNSHMRMLNISGMEDLIANSMDILEPAPVDSKGNQRENVMEAREPVDLFILPGLAFDKSGRRLGRGGGYYDTFLRNYQQLANKHNWKQPMLVALSYSSQILDDDVIPVTPNDVFIDALVSPAGVIPISSTAHNRMGHGL